MSGHIQWKEDLSAQEWDTILSSMHGHPLQSAKWGDSRKVVDGIKDIRLAVFKDDKPIYLVRFEERRFLGLFKVAWVPRGPTVSQYGFDLTLQEEFLKRLRKKGFLLYAITPWKKSDTEEVYASPTHTIWIDLTIGKDKLWSNLTKQCRYDVRRAKKLGIVVQKSNAQEDILRFYTLCQSISRTKNFFLNGSAILMSQLLENTIPNTVESFLFKAQYDSKFCGGAFVIRCGDSVHYMWAGVDRAFSKLNIGEAIQWEIIEWALSQNCKLYDLEGIDPKNNPGTYNFKKKLGGEIITLPGKKIYLLNRTMRTATNFLSLHKITSLFSLRRKYRSE